MLRLSRSARIRLLFRRGITLPLVLLGIQLAPGLFFGLLLFLQLTLPFFVLEIRLGHGVLVHVERVLLNHYDSPDLPGLEN